MPLKSSRASTTTIRMGLNSESKLNIALLQKEEQRRPGIKQFTARTRVGQPPLALSYPPLSGIAGPGGVPCAMLPAAAGFRAHAQDEQSEGTAMKRMETMAWTVSMCAGLRSIQAQTLGESVAAKDRSKRACRFTTDTPVEISDALRGGHAWSSGGSSRCWSCSIGQRSAASVR